MFLASASMASASAASGDAATKGSTLAPRLLIQDGGAETDGEQPEGGDAPADDGQGDQGDDGTGDGADETVEVDDPTAEREESLSAWWWVLAIVAGVGALAGMVMSLRRRRAEEAWDDLAANLCNAGRTVTGSFKRLDHRAPLAIPSAALVRLDRFATQVDRLGETPPHERAERVTSAVAAATEGLRDAVGQAQSSDGDNDAAPLRTDWDDVDVATATLDAALADLEREAMLGSSGASHPSGRPST